MAQQPVLPKWPTLTHERRLAGTVCGIDEAGCAPLAGPVVAAAVRLPTGPKPHTLRGLNDSKLLSAEQREHFFEIISEIADVGVGVSTVEEIDSLNIYHANLRAMRRAFDGLAIRPDHALVDGRAVPDLPCEVSTLIKGDRRSLSVAAASVIAKVTRDRIMHDLAADFPDYGWESNAGYGTEVHYLGLLRRGPSQHHRQSFAPINTIFSPMARGWQSFRFSPRTDIGDIDKIELLFLRADLHAVFGDGGFHLGVVKRMRGGWRFRAVGYGPNGEVIAEGGPAAPHHGQPVDAAEAAAVRRLLAGG